MRIGIDLTALLPEATGVDVALTGLVRELARIDRETAYTLFVNREDRALFADSLPPNFSIWAPSLRPRAARLLFQQGLLPGLAAALRIDVLHSPSFILPIAPGRVRHLLTVHDLTSFSRPGDHVPLRRSRGYLRAVRASVRRADLVTVPSAAVKHTVAHYLGAAAAAKTAIVPWGIGAEFRPLAGAAERAQLRALGVPEHYVLFVGTIEPRKNVAGLLEAYRLLLRERPEAPALVLAGRLGWQYENVIAELDRRDLRSRVVRIGYVPAAVLPALYAGATLFVYPSHEEGFGFPPLEAMACGTPTIVSDAPSLAENLTGAAELVSAGDVPALAGALRRLLGDAALRARRRELGLARARQYRWDATARRFVAFYQELARGTPETGRPGVGPGAALPRDERWRSTGSCL